MTVPSTNGVDVLLNMLRQTSTPGQAANPSTAQFNSGLQQLTQTGSAQPQTAQGLANQALTSPQPVYQAPKPILPPAQTGTPTQTYAGSQNLNDTSMIPGVNSSNYSRHGGSLYDDNQSRFFHYVSQHVDKMDPATRTQIYNSFLHDYAANPKDVQNLTDMNGNAVDTSKMSHKQYQAAVTDMYMQQAYQAAVAGQANAANPANGANGGAYVKALQTFVNPYLSQLQSSGLAEQAAFNKIGTSSTPDVAALDQTLGRNALNNNNSLAASYALGLGTLPSYEALLQLPNAYINNTQALNALKQKSTGTSSAAVTPQNLLQANTASSLLGTGY